MVASLMKRLCPAQLKQKIKLACGVPDTGACLAAMRRRGFSPRIAVDIGAYTGEWTLSLRQLFPTARVLMIEPQAARCTRLKTLTRVHSGLEFAPVLLGSRTAKAVTFFESETASSVLRDPGNGGARAVEREMTTLDAVTRGTHFERADFLKLDVQGYELEVLNGAEHVLASAEAVMMEVNLIAIYEGAPLAGEVVAFMAARGFCVYDVCTFFRRPLDNALWQMDVIFVRAASPLRASTRWD